MKESQIAINSVSTAEAALEETVAAYSEASFTNVEFPLSRVKAYLDRGHSIQETKQLLDTHGMRCIGGFETVIECFSSAESQQGNHARVVENAQLLSELGATILVVGTDGPPNLKDVPDPLDQIARVYGDVAAQVEQYGVTLCLEFNWSPVVKSVRAACEVARRSKKDNVGVLFDTAHYHCTPSKLDQLNADNVPYIRHVHVNDMRDKPGELCDCNADRVLPGDGCLDLNQILSTIEQHGYNGYFAIEMFNKALWDMPVADAATLMYQSMKHLCDTLP